MSTPYSFPVIERTLQEGAISKLRLEACCRLDQGHPEPAFDVTIPFLENGNDSTQVLRGRYPTLIQALEQTEQYILRNQTSNMYVRVSREGEVESRLNQLLLNNLQYGLLAERVETGIKTRIATLPIDGTQESRELLSVTRPTLSETLQFLDSIDISSGTLDYFLKG